MLTLRDTLRSPNISRWHTVLTNVKQDIASHSHCMGLIATYLLKAMIPNPSLEDKYAVLRYAQLHDLPEIVTGDMSSVFKRFLAENLDGFTSLMDKVEMSLTPDMQEILDIMENKPYLKHILKAADILEAHAYFLVSKGQDEQHNAIVFEKLFVYLNECVDKGQKVSPELNWQVLLDTKTEIESGDSVVTNFESRLTAIFDETVK